MPTLTQGEMMEKHREKKERIKKERDRVEKDGEIRPGRMKKGRREEQETLTRTGEAVCGGEWYLFVVGIKVRNVSGTTAHGRKTKQKRSKRKRGSFHLAEREINHCHGQWLESCPWC